MLVVVTAGGFVRDFYFLTFLLASAVSDKLWCRDFLVDLRDRFLTVSAGVLASSA